MFEIGAELLENLGTYAFGWLEVVAVGGSLHGLFLVAAQGLRDIDTDVDNLVAFLSAAVALHLGNAFAFQTKHCARLGAGLNVDPTRDKESENGMSARNANIVAAIKTIFGANTPKGHLPVNVPVVEESEDGTLKYGTEYLYERGFGLTY